MLTHFYLINEHEKFRQIVALVSFHDLTFAFEVYIAYPLELVDIGKLQDGGIVHGGHMESELAIVLAELSILY